MKNIITEAVNKVASSILTWNVNLNKDTKRLEFEFSEQDPCGCAGGALDISVGKIYADGLDVTSVHGNHDITLAEYTLNDEGEVDNEDVISFRAMHTTIASLQTQVAELQSRLDAERSK